MRKSRNNTREYTPSVTTFQRSDPQNLKREISTNRQKNYQDDTIIYGDDDALPLRIAQHVEDSPAASSCLETHAQFIRGAGFSNPELMKIVINGDGDTLWDLHCILSESLSVFWGFAVNLKFNRLGKITMAFDMSFESCRFKKPEGNSPYITNIVYNPYFGTTEYSKQFSVTYPVWDGKPDKLAEQMATLKKDFHGQAYYYGRTGPLSRFYPKPKYWSTRKWMYIDAKIQEAHAENMDNGWFQSVLMNVIGDPNEWSKNPKYQVEYEVNGVKKTRSTKTIGQEFNEEMAESFSGSKKMGSVQVHWAKNKETSTVVEEFPSDSNADLFLALQDLTTKNITIGTRTPSILANISEGVSLGSAGSEIQKAIELMQSNTSSWRQQLENFYNNVLGQNMETPFPDQVKIVNFNPVTQPIDVPDKFWNTLNPATKTQFIKDNFPNIKIIEPVAATTQVVNPDGTVTETPVPTAPAGNESVRTWSMADLNKIQKIVARYNLSIAEPQNPKALTFDQAKQILQGYGLTDLDINAWIVKPDEL